MFLRDLSLQHYSCVSGNSSLVFLHSHRYSVIQFSTKFPFLHVPLHTASTHYLYTLPLHISFLRYHYTSYQQSGGVLQDVVQRRTRWPVPGLPVSIDSYPYSIFYIVYFKPLYCAIERSMSTKSCASKMSDPDVLHALHLCITLHHTIHYTLYTVLLFRSRFVLSLIPLSPVVMLGVADAIIYRRMDGQVSVVLLYVVWCCALS